MSVAIKEEPQSGSLTPVSNFAPDVVVQQATEAARALQKVLDAKKKQVVINGQKYITYEDWQTLGSFYGLFVSTGAAEAVEVNGIKGAFAKAVVRNNQGIILGGS